MNKAEIKKEFQENFKELQSLLNSWELIPGALKDEFDSLNHQLLSHLYKDATVEKISRVINSELIGTYGLSNDLDDSKLMAIEIMEWWNFKNNILHK